MTDVTPPGPPGAQVNPIVVASGPTPRKVPGYGWIPDLPDHRDRIFNLENKIFLPTAVPSIADLTAQMPPVYDQSQIGACVGNGIAAAKEYQGMKEGKPADTPSRLFIYYNGRVIEGTVSQDSGLQIRDGIKTVVNQGVCSETLWPYDIGKFADQPSAEAYQAALSNKVVTYKRILVGGPGAPMRTAISQGYPIVLGFSVPDYFEQGWNPATTPLPLPNANSTIIGGHCVVLVGYDFTLQRFSVPVFKARNSWGPSWGEAGHFYFHYNWFTSSESLAGDMWIVETVAA